jgi:hypothetical protein
MSFTFVQKNATVSQDASATTVAVTLTGVGAGNLIVLVVRHENTPVTITASDGTTSLTAGNKITHSNNDFNGQMFYLLSANAGTVTYTATFSSSRPYRAIIAEEYSYVGTAVLDVQATGAYGTSTSIQSDSFATTGSDEVVIAGFFNYNSTSNMATPHIDTSTPDDYTMYSGSTKIGIASKTFGSTFTGYTDAVIDVSDPWIALALAFKIISGGGGSTSNISGLATASVGSVSGLAAASVATIDGVVK